MFNLRDDSKGVTKVGICPSLNDDLLHKKLIWDSVDVDSYFLLIFKTSCAAADRYTRTAISAGRQNTSLPHINVGIKSTEH